MRVKDTKCCDLWPIHIAELRVRFYQNLYGRCYTSGRRAAGSRSQGEMTPAVRYTTAHRGEVVVVLRE